MVTKYTIDSKFIYNVPGLLLNIKLSLMLMAIWQGNYHYHLHFTDEKTEAHRGCYLPNSTQ